MDNEFKATVVYAQICSASITFVASSFIATAIIWSPGRLTSPYRRLIFGLSLCRWFLLRLELLLLCLSCCCCRHSSLCTNLHQQRVFHNQAPTSEFSASLNRRSPHFEGCNHVSKILMRCHYVEPYQVLPERGFTFPQLYEIQIFVLPSDVWRATKESYGDHIGPNKLNLMRMAMNGTTVQLLDNSNKYIRYIIKTITCEFVPLLINVD